MTQRPTVEEVPVRLMIGGAPLLEWRCTPSDIEALVIGRLYADGVICDAGVMSDLVIHHGEGLIEARLSTMPTETAHPPHARGAAELPSPDAFAELFRDLFARIDARHQSGGMHGAALVRAGRIVYNADDVGRHNAVDKVLGMALMAGADLADCGLLVSSRVSGEIARKAASSGVAWLASRSIPTGLAVQIAKAAQMPIVGRAAGKNSVRYE